MTSAAEQLLLFEPDYTLPSPQWGGHQGLAPRPRWIYRVMRMAQTDPYCFSQSRWWFPVWSETLAQSTLFWAEAFKLIEPMRESGSGRSARLSQVRLSQWGQRWLEADPHGESLCGCSSGVGTVAPMLWLLYWKLLSHSCISKGVWWLWGTAQPSQFKSREQMAARLADYSEGALSSTLLKQEVKMLLELYLANPLASWEDQYDHPFWELGLLRYEAIEHLPMAQAHPQGGVGQGSSRGKGRGGGRAADRRGQRATGTAVQAIASVSAAKLKQSHIYLNQSPKVPPSVVLYAVIDYAISLSVAQTGTAAPTGSVPLAQVLYKDWSAPGILLRFSETAFHQAFDGLSLDGLTVSFLPDVGGAVLCWTRPLVEVEQELWTIIAAA